jgi:hypothetical protein
MLTGETDRKETEETKESQEKQTTRLLSGSSRLGVL